MQHSNQKYKSLFPLMVAGGCGFNLHGPPKKSFTLYEAQKGGDIPRVS